jgi:hypothetical protein
LHATVGGGCTPLLGQPLLPPPAATSTSTRGPGALRGPFCTPVGPPHLQPPCRSSRDGGDASVALGFGWVPTLSHKREQRGCSCRTHRCCRWEEIEDMGAAGGVGCVAIFILYRVTTLPPPPSLLLLMLILRWPPSARAWVSSQTLVACQCCASVAWDSRGISQPAWPRTLC